MVFNKLDKWMLDIELLRKPTPRERRQYTKIEVVRDKTYAAYQKHFSANKGHNERPSPKICKERAFRKSLTNAVDQMRESIQMLSRPGGH